MAAQSFMSACKQFFGTREGQTALDFAREVRALTDEDRTEIANGLRQNGIEINPDTI